MTTCAPKGTSETKPGKVRNTDIFGLPACLPPARLKASPTASPERDPCPSAPRMSWKTCPQGHTRVLRTLFSYHSATTIAGIARTIATKKLAAVTNGLQLQIRHCTSMAALQIRTATNPPRKTCNSALLCPTGFQQHAQHTSPGPHVEPRLRPQPMRRTNHV